MKSRHNLLIEVFYGGSHKQLLDTLLKGIDLIMLLLLVIFVLHTHKMIMIIFNWVLCGIFRFIIYYRIICAGLCLTDKDYLLVTLPDKKWHWKARTGALTILDLIPLEHNFKYVLIFKLNLHLKFSNNFWSSLFQKYIFKQCFKFGWIDCSEAWFAEFEKNCLFSWKSINLSREATKGERLSVRIQSNFNMVIF